jgi:YVTN family beta-propeller protein
MAHRALFYRPGVMGLKIGLFFILISVAFLADASPSGPYASERVYVVNSFQTNPPSHPSTVTMLNGSTISIMKNVSVGYDAHFIAASPDSSSLWVTCRGSNNIYVIDAANLEIIKKIDLEDVLVSPVGIAFMPNSSLAYIALESIGKLGVFDTTTYSYVSSIPVGGNPAFVAFTPDGLKAYVVDYLNSLVKVIRTSDNAVVATLALRGHKLQDAVVSPDGSVVYVSNQDRNQIEVIRTKDDANLVPIPTGQIHPQGIGISPDGSYLFIGFVEGEVDMFRLMDKTAVSTQEIAGNGRSIATRPDGSRIFVSGRDKDKCYAFDAVGERLTFAAVANMDTTPDFKAFPYGLAVIEKPVSSGYRASNSGPEVNMPNSSEIKKTKVNNTNVPGFEALVAFAALVLTMGWIWRRS